MDEHFLPSTEEILQDFFKKEDISLHKQELFKEYLVHLQDWNKKFNITALEDEKDIIYYHFQDSLKIKDFFPFGTISSLADVGSGGGFPGIPLSIYFPHMRVTLIEVNLKKVQFLEFLIKELSLDNVEVISLDWRTFLRKTSYVIDVFCARASLSLDELFRIFKAGCPYRESQLIYWASATWQATEYEKQFLVKEFPYTVGIKKRKYVFFAARKGDFYA